MRIALFTSLFLIAAVTNASPLEVTKGRSIGEPVCGGLPGFLCPNPDKEWCDYPEGATCGIGDYFGTCRKRPDLCPEIYLPVCGCNGETYSNSCHAAAAGFDVAHPGKCR